MLTIHTSLLNNLLAGTEIFRKHSYCNVKRKKKKSSRVKMNVFCCTKFIFCITTYFAVKSVTQNVHHMNAVQGFGNIKIGWINFKKYSQRFFNTFPFHQEIVPNPAKCQRLCILKETCKSFNLLPVNDSFQCQLLNHTFYTQSCKLERHLNAMHYIISVSRTQKAFSGLFFALYDFGKFY